MFIITFPAVTSLMTLRMESRHSAAQEACRLQRRDTRDGVSSLRKEDRRFTVICSASDVSWDMSKRVRLGTVCCSTV